MKPVVSSIVALAIAITPALAMAAEKSTHKPASAKVVKHQKKDAKITPVKYAPKEDRCKKSAIQKINHKIGHEGEPKVDHGVTVIPASMTTKTAYAMPRAKPADLPKLPAPAKPASAKEKGARKPAEKKAVADDKSSDGQPERDEDFAELVARIGGTDKAKHRAAKPEKPCTKDPVEIARGAELESFPLTTCDGAIAPTAIERMSVLVRPATAPRPTAPLAELAKRKGADIAKGIKRIDPGLVARLQAIADHFGQKGAPVKVSIVSGYRPASVGSLHQTGRAMDFHLEGANDEDVVDFCKTLADTGCGYYPNSSFVHVDVREPGAGHVSWIDASGPGEAPRYVSAWPPPPAPASAAEAEDKGLENATAKLPPSIADAPNEPVEEQPSETTTR